MQTQHHTPRSSRRSRGMSPVAIIISILILLVVGGGIFYMVSDPFKAKVDDVTRQATQWTPENIAEDPEGYAQYALGQMDEYEQSLKARQIEMATREGTLTRQIESAEAQISVDQERMIAIKEEYKRALSEEVSFPISVGNASLDQDDAERLMVDAKQRVDAQNEVLSRTRPILSRVQRDLQRTREALGQVDSKRQEIRSQLETIRLQETFDDWESVDETMEAVAATVTALGTDVEYEVSLDDLDLDAGTDDGGNTQLTSDEKDVLAEILAD